MEQLNFVELEEKVKQFTDLKELPYLCELIESNGRELDRGMYMKLHTETIPEQINKLWFNGLLLNGEPMESIIYDKIEPELRGFLNNEGIDAQECFLSVNPGWYNEDYPDNWILEFYMGFDLFGDDEGDCGWAIFKFILDSQGYSCFNRRNFEKVTMQPLEVGFGFNWGHGEPINYYISRGKRTFYSYKTPSPYKGLHDYFSDGGYTLRLD